MPASVTLHRLVEVSSQVRLRNIVISRDSLLSWQPSSFARTCRSAASIARRITATTDHNTASLVPLVTGVIGSCVNSNNRTMGIHSLRHRYAVAVVVAVVALTHSAALGALADAATAGKGPGAAGGGAIDLTHTTYAGAGVGFMFQDGNATADGESSLAALLPHCTQEPLDSLYFYVYGCRVPSAAVRKLHAAVPGFEWASDKSITERAGDADSFLVANAFNLTLTYAAASSGEAQQAAALCEGDLARVKASGVGCGVVAPSCGGSDARGAAPSLTLGCGSLTCEGCLLPRFFTEYAFTTAAFDAPSTA